MDYSNDSEMKAREEIAASCPIGSDLNSYLIGYANGFTDAQPEDAFFNAARELVQAVEGYVCPKKDDKYVFRNEVLAKCNKLKQLLNETE